MKKNTLAHHNIRMLFWINLFGTASFIEPVLTLFYLERGLTEQHILWIMMFWSGSVLIGELPTGIYADRFGAKISFMTGSAVRFISIVLLFYAAEPWQFFLYSSLNGISVTFFSGAEEALIYESLKRSREQHLMDRAMGNIRSAVFLTSIVTVLAGAYLAKDLTDQQFHMLIVLGMVFHAVEFFLLFFVRQPPGEQSFRGNPFAHITTGIQVIWSTPPLFWLFLNVSIVFITAGAVFENFDQPFLTKAGLPVEWIGAFYALSALLGFAVSRSIGLITSRVPHVVIMYVTGIGAAAGLLLAGLLGCSLLTAGAIFFGLRLIRAVRDPVYSQLTNDWIPSGSRATTLSLLSIIDSVLDLVIFGMLSGLADSGLSIVFLAAAAIALIGALIPVKKAPAGKEANGELKPDTRNGAF
ncbi:MFS transporter [Bacillus marinisedimentorum]|uniref:MFS transporter n=1 Tax=Bacillus marinisedimentorum TaxID=1821260 RepID=UPI001B80942A|nr:MFS transporter [Bacillus marinisedimentorum]